ncbi:hypothetical protein [Tardiphaga sp.]|jgi:hypothetical protein|uniref:hypothetical protein n=1 Tax=Tardiphaga sp. TaxID=1926292 RepID=UPI0037D9AC4F
MSTLPENFDLLAAGEDQIRALSKAAIEASPDLLLHARMIEASMSTLDKEAKQHEHKDEDDLVMKMLAARMFNSAASTMRLLMTGYYQSAIMILRDILETAFLLDYFRSFPDRIPAWRQCTEEERRKKFSAVKIRTALDERDGAQGLRRAKDYNQLCELGTHPTYRGFGILTRQNSDLVNVGPFFNLPALNATLAETAKSIMQAAVHARVERENRTLDDFAFSIAFMRIQKAWGDRFFGGSGVTDEDLSDMQALLDEVRRRGGN